MSIVYEYFRKSYFLFQTINKIKLILTQTPGQQQQQQQQQFEYPVQAQQQPQVQQPALQVQEQFLIPQNGDLDCFKTAGTIHSYIVTPTSPWNATGDWTLIVENEKVKNFITNMTWFNGTCGHTHDFLNFDYNGDTELSSDKIVTIEGEMDATSKELLLRVR